MTDNPFIEEQAEAQQLRTKIDALRSENVILRQNQSPAAGPLELQAENIVLRREAEILRQSVPKFVRYRGPLPQTMEKLSRLPASHQRQILREHPDYFRKLQEAHAILREAGRHGQRETRRLAALEGVGVASMEDLAVLPLEQRRSLVMKMKPQQRRALLGLSATSGLAGRDDQSDQSRRGSYL